MYIPELSCSELASLISQGDLLATEVCDALIERVQKYSGANAFTELDAEAVRQEAQECDSLRATGHTRGPLHGVPVSFKDNINVLGYRTTAGTPGMRDFRPASDAPVARRLRQAGAVAFGKNNMHELAYGTTTNNALFGPAHNPFDPDLVCGGSSGGSACAVAHRMVPASIGTDTGGSVRIPAAFCGLWGYRPSSGRWPTAGIVPISQTRDTPGPIARTPADLNLLDSLVVGFSEVPKPDMIRDLRIGIAKFFWDTADADVVKICEEVLEQLQTMGAVVKVVDDRSLVAPHIASTSNIAHYEGRVTLEEFLEIYNVGRSFEAVARSVASDGVRSILMDQLSAETMVAAEIYAEAVRVHRPELQNSYRRIFRDNSIDVLAFPTSLIPPPHIGDDETVILNGEDVPLFTASIHNTDVGSNAGLPGITLPAGLIAGRIPVGLSFDAAAGADRLLLDIALCLGESFPSLSPKNLAQE
jgi:mandelamide amidase